MKKKNKKEIVILSLIFIAIIDIIQDIDINERWNN